MSAKKQKGFIVVLAGPTGVGESTVTRAVIRVVPRAKRLVTTTTRAKRPGERDGREYFFIARDAFRKKILRKKFLEHIYLRSRGVYYGSDRAVVERGFARGHILFFNCELKGLRVMQKEYPHTLSIFLKPENLRQIVERKLRQHPGITKKELATRFREARREMREARHYTHHVVNREGELQETVRRVVAIIQAHARQLTG